MRWTGRSRVIAATPLRAQAHELADRLRPPRRRRSCRAGGPTPRRRAWTAATTCASPRAPGPCRMTSEDVAAECACAAATSCGGTNARADCATRAPEKRYPMTDAARAAAQAVPNGTGSSRRLFGEGGSRSSRMGRPERRAPESAGHPSKAVGPRRFTRSSESVVDPANARFQKISRHHGSGRHAKSASARSIAPVAQLLDAQRLAELRERDRAEVGGAERGDVEREIGLVVGALARRRPRAASARRSSRRPRRAPRARAARPRRMRGPTARRRRRRAAPTASRASGSAPGAAGRGAGRADGRAGRTAPRRPPSSRRRAGSARSPPWPAASSRAPRARRAATPASPPSKSKCVR